MRLIDTHTHLYEPEFDADREDVLARAADAGVERFMFPAIDPDSWENMFAMCRRHRECLPMLGLHPTSVNDNPSYRDELERVEQMLAEPPVERLYGVGEVGIDLYWSRDWQREQTEAFEYQVELSIRYGLPLVIHTRSAWREVIEVLERYRGRGLRGVMHAFGGTLEQYEAVKRCGDFVFGIGGVITYKNSGLAATVAGMSIDDLVLETDSPYLTPVPFRGKRNESGYLCYICRKVAEVKGLSEEETAEKTTLNAERMFGLESMTHII